MGAHGTYSVSHELDVLLQNKADIKAAIEAKRPDIAPTEVMSKWPDAIMSIPSPAKWAKPSEWPDIKAAIGAYPEGATSSETNALIILFDLRCGRNIRLRGGTSFRYSDSPQTVYTAANVSTTVYHEFPSQDYGWAAVYGASPVNLTDSNSVAALIEGTQVWTQGSMLWIVGAGSSSWRPQNNRGIVAAEFDHMSIASMTSLCQNALALRKCTWNSIGTYADMQVCFGNSTSLQEVTTSGLVTAETKNINGIFAESYNIRYIDVSDWDVSNVSNLGRVFSGCHSLPYIDVSRWDTSSATVLSSLFSGCYSLTSVDVSRFDTSHCTSIDSCFNSCRSMLELDISEWDVSSVKNFGSLFNGSSALRIIDISKWVMSSATYCVGMFDSCYSLTSIIGKKTVAADGSIDGSSAYFGKGPPVSLNMSAASLLNRDSLLFLIYWIPEVSNAQTLTLGNTNKAKLTSDEMAIATAKGWTVT